LGAVKIYAEFLTGTGADSDWVPNTGTALDAVADNPNADGTTTTIESSGVGQRSNFAADVAGSGDILGTMTTAILEKDSAGAREAAIECKVGSTYDAGSSETLTTSFVPYTKVWNVNPDTGTAWTPTTLADQKIGVKVTA